MRFNGQMPYFKIMSIFPSETFQISRNAISFPTVVSAGNISFAFQAAANLREMTPPSEPDTPL